MSQIDLLPLHLKKWRGGNKQWGDKSSFIYFFDSLILYLCWHLIWHFFLKMYVILNLQRVTGLMNISATSNEQYPDRRVQQEQQWDWTFAQFGSESWQRKTQRIISTRIRIRPFSKCGCESEIWQRHEWPRRKHTITMCLDFFQRADLVCWESGLSSTANRENLWITDEFQLTLKPKFWQKVHVSGALGGKKISK